MKQYCTFWVSERLYGVNIMDVKEINSVIEFTPIFHTPEKVRGYVNIRGQIYLIIDLRLSLGFEKQEKILPDNRIVLFKLTVGESFGVLVDSISDVVEVDEQEIADRRKQANENFDDNDRRQINKDLADGVCMLDENLLVVLNAKSILNSITI